MIRTFVLLLLTVPTAMAQATFHGDAARTGVYPAPGPLQLNGTKWTFKTDGPIIGSPAVSDGVVYIGSTDGNLYAVDQETGKQKWKFKTFATTGYFITNGRQWSGLFRRLRWKSLCGRCPDRHDEMD